MDAFTRDLGIHQGRILRASAPEGAYVYELGHSLMKSANLQVGDLHEIAQTIQMENEAHFVRASVVVGVPPGLPVGASWEVSAWLRGVRMVSRKLRHSKRPIVLDDWRIRLRSLGLDEPSEMELKFRLEIVDDGIPGDALLDEGGEALVSDDDENLLIYG